MLHVIDELTVEARVEARMISIAPPPASGDRDNELPGADSAAHWNVALDPDRDRPCLVVTWELVAIE